MVEKVEEMREWEWGQEAAPAKPTAAPLSES